jgi:hypothetical protein
VHMRVERASWNCLRFKTIKALQTLFSQVFRQVELILTVQCKQIHTRGGNSPNLPCQPVPLQYQYSA